MAYPVFVGQCDLSVERGHARSSFFIDA
jgi:hypothetical protein